MNTPSEPTDLSDEAIQERLAKESVRGPRFFRGKPLAAYSAGLRDLVISVVPPNCTASFHDVTLLYILAEAYAETPEQKVAKRRALIVATDNAEAFRAKVSIEVLDELSDAEILQARQIVNDILTPVDLAQTAVATKPGKKEGARKARNPLKSTR